MKQVWDIHCLLGANIEPLHMSDGKYSWSITCDSYFAASVQNIKYLLSEDNKELKSGKRPHNRPLSHGYKTELDVIDECDAEHVYWFQQIIGILQLKVELGMIGIQKEVVLLSQ